MISMATVRYCEECGHETKDRAPATHCGQPMLLVNGVVVIDDHGPCRNCGALAGEPCEHDAGCIDSDRG